MQLDLWAQQAINGLTLGSIYALVALGYTMVYGVLQMINFAHGEVFMVGSYAGFFTLTALFAAGFGQSNLILTLIIVFLVAMVVGGILAVGLERVAYRPLRRAPRLAPLISAIGASIFLQNAVLVIFGPRLQVYPYVFPAGGVSVGNVSITYIRIFIILLSLAFMLGLHAFVRRTSIGIAMRAVAEDKDTAALMGIDVDRTIATTFLVGGALAGAAGVMVGMYYTQINHMIGFVPGLKAFTAAVLGGIGNVPGAMIGGLFLGLIEAFSAQAIPAVYKDVVAFGLLVLVLILRPTGILGEVIGKK